MKRALSAVFTLCLAVCLGLSTISVAGAAQQSVTIVPPVGSGLLCPLAASIPDNGLTTITTNTDGSCTFAAALSVTSVQGNSVTNTLLSDAALSEISTLKAQGWGGTGIHELSILGNGTAPTLGTCGSGTIAATSTDTAGDVTATGATSCIVDFNQKPVNKPVCVAIDETGAHALDVAYTTSAGLYASFTIAGLTSGDEFQYICKYK